MKTVKSVLAVFIFSIISVIAGCSDQVVSTDSSAGGQSKMFAESMQERRLYATIKIKPGRSYQFNKTNTGYSRFIGIDVVNRNSDPLIDGIQPECEGILIHTDNNSNDYQIDCHGRGFISKTITIENTSTHMLDLNVTLICQKVRNDPSEN